jgi:hypothetical protein
MGDGEYPKVFSECTPKARKAHRCTECWGTIEKGETYHRIEGMWDRWETHKFCMHCKKLRDYFSKDCRWDDQPCFGELNDYVFEGRKSNPAVMHFYIATIRMRGGKVQDWQQEHLDKCRAHQPGEFPPGIDPPDWMTVDFSKTTGTICFSTV